MSNDKFTSAENFRFWTGCFVQVAIAVVSLFVSGLICWYQVHVGNKLNSETLNSNQSIADQQARLDIELDAMEQLRKSPMLTVLRSIHAHRDAMNCIIQNTGERDLVIFGFSLEPITPQNELKGGNATGPINRPIIESAERSRVAKIDLAMIDLDNNRQVVYDPAIIVKPGESLTLKFIFPTPTRGFILRAISNDQSINEVEDNYLFHFQPKI